MSTSPHADDTVTIIGAGPGGLALARLLQARGVAVKVYERDPSPTVRRQGGSLDLRPDSGQRMIRAAGLEEVFASRSRRDATAFTFLNPQGEVIPGEGEQTHQDPGPEIDRGDLRAMLLESLEPATVAWGHAVTDVVRSDGRWRVEFADQPATTTDLVIGADGIGSRVRRRLTPVRPRYTGHTMLAAVAPSSLWHDSPLSDLVGQGSVMVADGHRTIFVQRCADDLILIYFSMAVPQDWPTGSGFALEDTACVLAAVSEAYQGWSPEVLDLLLQVEGEFQRWPLSVVPPDHAWPTQPGLTMLGDASHAMPPFTGKGVNLALLDALELADALTDGSGADLAESLRRFEAGMQERTRTEVEACLAVGRDLYGIEMDFAQQAVA